MNLIQKTFFLLDNNDKKKSLNLIFLFTISTIMEILSIGLIIPFVSVLLDIDYLDKIRFFLNSFFINFNFFSVTNKSLIIMMITSFIFLYIFKLFFMFFVISYRTKFSSSISTKLSHGILTSYLFRDYFFHLSNNSSKLILNCRDEVLRFSFDIILSTLEIITEVFIILGLLGLLFYIEPFGTLVVILFAFITSLSYLLYTHNKIMKWGNERRINDVISIKNIQTSLGGIKEIIINSRQNFFLQPFLASTLKANNFLRKQQTLLDSSKYYIELVAVISVFSLIYFLINFSNESQTLAITKLSLFAAVFFKVLPSLNRMLASRQKIIFSIPVIEILYKEILNLKSLKLNKYNNIKKNSFNFQKNIKLKNIHFSYQDKSIFKNIDLNIKKGETIAIIGESGSGKSTLLSLIIGLIKPQSGEIFIDNQNIKNIKSDFQGLVGLIPQSFYMLDDTIRSNIIFKPNYADLSYDGEIYECLKKAQIYDFVTKLPRGLDTIIGERGSRISVGQAQRLSIARALFKKPKILVLDEATSALDYENEKNFLDVIKKLKGNDITLIIVSHKLKSLNFVDNIYKIENKELKK